jgi:hypothetical protein
MHKTLVSIGMDQPAEIYNFLELKANIFRIADVTQSQNGGMQLH